MGADRKRSGRISVAGLCVLFMLFTTLLTGATIGTVFYALRVVDKSRAAELVDGTEAIGPDGDRVFALIRVAMNRGNIVYQKDGTNTNDYKVFKNTQLGLIKSPFVFKAALRKQKIADLGIVKQEKDPLVWLQHALKADYVNDSEIMRVSLMTDKPDEAKVLVDAIVDAYIEEVVNRKEKEQRAMAAQLTQIYNSKENEVRSKRASLINLAEKLNVSNSDAAKVQMTVGIQELAEQRSELRRLKSDLGKAEGAVKAGQAKLKRLNKTPVSEIELEKHLTADPVCKKTAEMIDKLRQAMAQQKKLNKPDEKPAANARLPKQLAGLEKEYEIRKNELRQLIKGTKRAEIEEKIAATQVQVNLLSEQMKTLSAHVDAQREKVSDIGKSSVDIEMMTAELKSLEKVLDDIRTQREKLSIESRARPRITRQSAAQVESRRDKFSY